jgi:hypothetical protein
MAVLDQLQTMSKMNMFAGRSVKTVLVKLNERSTMCRRELCKCVACVDANSLVEIEHPLNKKFRTRAQTSWQVHLVDTLSRDNRLDVKRCLATQQHVQRGSGEEGMIFVHHFSRRAFDTDANVPSGHNVCYIVHRASIRGT